MKCPIQAKELTKLLREDQKEWRAFAKIAFETKNQDSLKGKKAEVRQNVSNRAKRMLKILDDIGEPSLSNIGAEAAQAVSILALHDSIKTLQKTLKAFMMCAKRNREDTYLQAIPSMTDWTLILARKPQKFGTIWFFDVNKKPFLPTVGDFEHVNDRRAEYNIEPLHWPRLLPIPESKQPWLKRPLSELIMRKPTPEEYEEHTKDF